MRERFHVHLTTPEGDTWSRDFDVDAQPTYEMLEALVATILNALAKDPNIVGQQCARLRQLMIFWGGPIDDWMALQGELAAAGECRLGVVEISGPNYCRRDECVAHRGAPSPLPPEQLETWADDEMFGPQNDSDIYNEISKHVRAVWCGSAFVWQIYDGREWVPGANSCLVNVTTAHNIHGRRFDTLVKRLLENAKDIRDVGETTFDRVMRRFCTPSLN